MPVIGWYIVSAVIQKNKWNISKEPPYLLKVNVFKMIDERKWLQTEVEAGGHSEAMENKAFYVSRVMQKVPVCELQVPAQCESRQLSPFHSALVPYDIFGSPK